MPTHEIIQTRMKKYEKLRKNIDNEIIVIDSVLKNTNKLLSYTKRLNALDSDFFAMGNLFFNSTQKLRNENELMSAKKKKVSESLEEINNNSLRRTKAQFDSFKSKYDSTKQLTTPTKIEDLDNLDEESVKHFKISINAVISEQNQADEKINNIHLSEIPLEKVVENKTNDLKEIINQYDEEEKEFGSSETEKEVEDFLNHNKWSENELKTEQLVKFNKGNIEWDRQQNRNIILNLEKRNFFLVSLFLITLVALTIVLIFI